MSAEQASQGDREASPQFRGVPGEQHVGTVVIAVTAQGLPEYRVVAVVDGGAPTGTPVRAPPEFTVWVAAPPGPGGSEVVCTAPNPGAVRVAKTMGCSAIVAGSSWCPPSMPAWISCQVSPA